MKISRQVRVALIAAAAATLTNVGTARAGVDDEASLVDRQGRTMTVQQWDTFLNGVSPLDRNRLTREWFHSGRAAYVVDGAGADGFVGVLELGYQVSFPWTMGVGINFSYTTPNVALGADFGSLDLGLGFGDGDLLQELITPPLFPGLSISTDLGNGPGIQEVATFSVDVTGPNGAVAVASAHGTVTGVGGGVLLRPYARLISSNGDIATTYGEVWNMN